MEIWQAIVLGAVQGFSEFLPVSSSGHLLLLQNWFGIQENAFFYTVMLHFGTLIPVVIVLWKQILELLKKPFNKFLYLVIASIPAGIVGLLFSKVIDLDYILEQNVWLLSITFLITAGAMLFSEIRAKKIKDHKPLTHKTALYMGLGQAMGVVSGISRSGATLTAGNIAKVNREDNASFTFLMSIPVILAAILLESLDVVLAGSVVTVDIVPLIFGIITAMICGYIAIKVMLKIIKKANYKWFSLYLVIISIANLIVYFVR